MSELPDFHIDHREKIEWMIETAGWALEPVAPDAATDPPTPAYAYTIGLPALVGFPEIVVFGLTPVATRGLLDLVVGLLRDGTEIPLGVELTGLFDNDLRCIFAPVEDGARDGLFPLHDHWYGGESVALVQLLWPDRNGFLPTEPGYATTMRLAQPVIAAV
jgi:hypothetical protein